MTADDVSGTWDPRFAPVIEALAANRHPSDAPSDSGDVADPGDLGAAVCITVGGRVVVDVWRGWMDRDRTRPWREHTLTSAYSTLKRPTPDPPTGRRRS